MSEYDLQARSNFQGHPGLSRLSGHFPGHRAPPEGRAGLSQFIGHFPGPQHPHHTSHRALTRALRASPGSGKTWRDHLPTSHPPLRANEPPYPAAHFAGPVPVVQALQVHPDRRSQHQTPRRRRHSAQPYPPQNHFALAPLRPVFQRLASRGAKLIGPRRHVKPGTKPRGWRRSPHHATLQILTPSMTRHPRQL